MQIDMSITCQRRGIGRRRLLDKEIAELTDLQQAAHDHPPTLQPSDDAD